eukprot:8148093-Prorocentrum_lima.AAC.1
MRERGWARGGRRGGRTRRGAAGSARVCGARARGPGGGGVRCRLEKRGGEGGGGPEGGRMAGSCAKWRGWPCLTFIAEEE